MTDQGVELATLAESGDALGLRLALTARAHLQPDLSDSLALAAKNGYANCVKLLLPVSDPLAYDSHALRWAADKGHAECVALLLPVSDPMANDSEALRSAARVGNAQCVALLLPFSRSERILQLANEARQDNLVEMAGMMEAFIEAQALSNELPSKKQKSPRYTLAL